MHALDALGSPVRRQILLELREGPLAVGDLASRFTISRPAVSRHLGMLERAGLVEAQLQGSKSLYSVQPAGFAEVRQFMDGFWDVALQRLEHLARAQGEEP